MPLPILSITPFCNFEWDGTEDGSWQFLVFYAFLIDGIWTKLILVNSFELIAYRISNQYSTNRDVSGRIKLQGCFIINRYKSALPKSASQDWCLFCMLIDSYSYRLLKSTPKIINTWSDNILQKGTVHLLQNMYIEQNYIQSLSSRLIKVCNHITYYSSDIAVFSTYHSEYLTQNCCSLTV